jgi:hypothetical protein
MRLKLAFIVTLILTHKAFANPKAELLMAAYKNDLTAVELTQFISIKM